MIIYLLKFISCSGLLLLFYYSVLQNDRLFRFNRLFLLAIVILALVIPITIVRTQVIEIPISQEPIFSQIEAPILDNASVLDIPTTFESTSEPSINWGKGVWITYLLVTSILLFRFSRNLHSILRLKRKSLIVAEEGIKIVLRTDIKASFSFLNHMYTNRTRYEQGNLPTEIIEHEKHHIDQKHSYDIIYIELLQCVLWFNPFIYLIKAAIKLNHEFLADQHVLKDNTSVYDYQKILLDITKKQFVNTPAFASNLNYGFTKKRLNMMTKNTNKVKSMIKQVAAAGIIAGAFSIGGETKVIAQETDIPVNLDVTVSPELDESLNTEREIDLKVSLTKQDTINPKKLKRPSSMVQNCLVRFKDKDGEVVQAKYKVLSEEQKARFLEKDSEGQFFLPPPPKGMMNQALLDDFMDPEKYGVWIDGKRINNDKLKTYSPSDFHHYTKSTLLKNAKDYSKYTFHLSLTSIKHFESKDLTKGKWLDLSTPTIIEIPEQKTAKDKRNQEPIEVASIRSAKAKPQVIEVKSVREEKIKEEPQAIKVKSIRQERIKDIDKKLSYLIPRTVKFKNNEGTYVEKSFGQLTLDEKLLLISKKGDGRYLAGTWSKNHKVSIEDLQKTYDPVKYRLNIDEKPAELSLLKKISPETLASLWIQPSNDFLKKEIIMVWTKKYFDERFEVTPSGRIWSKLVELKSVPEERTNLVTADNEIKPVGKQQEAVKSQARIIKTKAIEIEVLDKKSNTSYSLSPFPSLYFHHNSLVRLSNENGKKLQAKFIDLTKSDIDEFASGKAVFYSQPFAQESITEDDLKDLLALKNVEVWIDNKKTNSNEINQLDLKTIHHTEKHLSAETNQINFMTLDGFMQQGGKEGRWVELPSSILNTVK